jgi:adenosine deaminase
VRDREIPLELSPSSNLQTGAIAQWGEEIEDHPFDLLYQLGFAVTVNVDNRLMSRTSLTRELQVLAETFDYDLADLEAFQLNAAAGAFLTVEEREELIELIAEGFAR